jgi:hypothetical protein
MADKTNENVAPPKAPAGGITKLAAVRQALAKLGRKAMPLQIQGFVKQQYGIEMTNDHISNCKSEILRKRRKGKSPARKPAAKQDEARKPTAVAAGGNGKSNDIPLKDILTIKDLVVRLGAEPLRTLIAAFAH